MFYASGVFVGKSSGVGLVRATHHVESYLPETGEMLFLHLYKAGVP